MAYTKQEWVDHYEGESGEGSEGYIEGTPLNAEHMNHMEEGIYEASRVVVYFDSSGYLCVDATNASTEDDSE